MNKSITILEKDYKQWLKELSSRYRRSQIKAAVKVNEEMLRFYWELGRDIVERDAENKYGHNFYATLSNDLKVALSEECAISPSTIRYTKRFYLLYCQYVGNLQQLAEKLEGKNLQQLAEKSDKQFAPKLGAIITGDIFSIPWGHHMLLIDKVKGNAEKALFYVHQTVFYDFAFTGITGRYNERLLKDKLLNNITQFF